MSDSPPAVEALKRDIAHLSIAEVLARYPQSHGVIFNHFGASCFECPAKAEETLALGIRVHQTDEEPFYADLLAALEGDGEG
jgi:hypothetical protein